MEVDEASLFDSVLDEDELSFDDDVESLFVSLLDLLSDEVFFVVGVFSLMALNRLRYDMS